MENLKKEFRQYSVKHQGLNGMRVDKYMELAEAQTPNVTSYITPNIIEERQMNIAVMDVFSRLMMDAIENNVEPEPESVLIKAPSFKAVF